MKAAEVRLDGIGKRFGETWAVRGVTLRIGRGELYTFLGPSGCGKTTLLRTIAGFAVPDEGDVFIDGDRVTDVPPWQRDVGLVFQSYALWPHLSVFENVAFGLRERKVPRAEIERRVRDALGLVDLEGMEDRRPSQLSGGQQQRVALARTLVIQPRVLLLDEPLSNLDAKLRTQMRLELQKLQRDLGLTTVYVTHDQEEALGLSTRIAVMARGEVIQEGTPREIYDHPRAAFVAEFVGSANFFRGRLRRAGADRLELETDRGLRLALRPPAGAAGSGTAAEALATVRPEAIRLVPLEQAVEHANRLPGRIAARAFQGAFVQYEVALEAGDLLRAQVPYTKAGRVFDHGQPVVVAFHPDDVTLVGVGALPPEARR